MVRECNSGARLVGPWIALGGAVGAVLRFLIGGWVTTWAGAAFPWATFGINVSGSLLLGWLHGALPRITHAPHVRASLTAGLCGGFTTFSTFDYETLVLLQEGRLVAAATYIVATVVACVAGVLVGMGAAGRAPAES